MCNIAISRYSVARAHASGNGASAGGSDVPLVRAAVRRARLDGVDVTLRNDFPTGAGLGGSSAASAAILGALAAWRGAALDPAAIAEEGRRIEVEELGVAGGRQDHYAATHGGALALTFSDCVSVRRLPLGARAREELLASCILVYSGESRISSDTITAVLGAYEAGDARVRSSLRRMRELAIDMASALETSDIHALGELVGEHWVHQRALHPSIPTSAIDAIIEAAGRAGASGAKAMGASGGGCVLILASPGSAERVRASVARMGEILDFGIDDGGVTVVSGAP